MIDQIVDVRKIKQPAITHYPVSDMKYFFPIFQILDGI